MSGDFEIVACAPPASTATLNHQSPSQHQWIGPQPEPQTLSEGLPTTGRRSQHCCSRCWGATCTWITSPLGITIIFLFYLMVGATIFMVFGNTSGNQSRRPAQGGETSLVWGNVADDPDGQLLEKTLATVDRLWAITEDLNILYRDNWTALARIEMRHYQAEIVHTLRRTMLEERYSFRQTWSFPMSLLYVVTLVTTIGYGFYTPSTIAMRCLTSAYSIFGIPLFLLYLSVVGERLARFISRIVCCSSCCYRHGQRRNLGAYRQYSDVTLALQPMTGNGHVSTELNAPTPLLLERDHEDLRTTQCCCGSQVPLLVCGGLLAVFVAVSSLILALVEPNLGYFDSLHLLVNLLLTLGFAGHLLPGLSAEEDVKSPSQVSLILVTCLILTGMALLSASFNVVMETGWASPSRETATASKANKDYRHIISSNDQLH